MKSIALVPNTLRDKDYKYTKELINIIGGRAETVLAKEHSSAGGNARYVRDSEVFAEADAVIALGGDGTMLSAADEVAKHGIPILGINLGHLGFLAEIEPAHMREAVESLLGGRFGIEERAMIKGEVYRGVECISAFHALNDIVISRASFSRLLSLRTDIDDTHLLDSFVADGVIFSTPTGSTAYSLSAGGPILDPSLEAMVITPICAHTMHTRPMVIPFERKISVRLERGQDDDGAFVSADGRHGVSIIPGDTVTVSRSCYNTRLIKIMPATFYDTIRRKLNERGALK